MVDRSPIVVHAASAWAERLVSALLGRRAIGVRRLAQGLTESDLERFPPVELAETEEHNDFLLDAERRGARWRRLFRRVPADLDPERVESLCCQRFILVHGRRASQLRQLLRLWAPQPVRVATDLPRSIVDGLLGEPRWQPERLQILALASASLRALAYVDDVARLARQHAAAIVRLVQMRGLARSAGTGLRYAAWLGASAADLAARGSTVTSLADFLEDALSGGAVDEILVQGEKPRAALPSGVRWCPGRYPARKPPATARLLGALCIQAGQLVRDIARSLDWRHRQLLAPVLVPAPGTLLWLRTDPPAAVIYSNALIGGEPLAAAAHPRLATPSTMVFYSANVAYVVPPGRSRVPTDLEPEMRHIAAGKLAMWSPEMASAFHAAGYATSRLPQTGVVHFARQGAFRRDPVRPSDGPIRIGVFDVSAQTPGRRFLTGWGQTLYHSGFCRAFFSDVVAAAQGRWGTGFVVVRKLKRQLDPKIHAEDVDLAALLPAARLRGEPATASLWHVLSAIDLVICMPFTSVAFMAEQYGIPAAYYDPLGVSIRSSLGGRALLLRGRAELERWLDKPSPLPARDPTVNVAAETLRAACGLSFQGPRPLEEVQGR